MDASEFQNWRSAMGLTQHEAADKLGISRMTVALYERGYRHEDERPVLIPRHIELACAALWVGVTGFSGDAVLGLRDIEPNDGAGKVGRLPSNKVPEVVQSAVRQKLEQKKTVLGPHLMFPLPLFLGKWREVEPWCKENLDRGSYDLRSFPNESIQGGGVAVILFRDDVVATLFKIAWC